MRPIKLYALLSWAFFLSLFVPTTAMASRVERILAEIKAQEQPGDGSHAP